MNDELWPERTGKVITTSQFTENCQRKLRWQTEGEVRL